MLLDIEKWFNWVYWTAHGVKDVGPIWGDNR